MSKLGILFFISIVITSCTNISSVNKPSTEKLSGNIIYLSDRDTNLEIYSLNLENNQSKNLTNNKSDDFMHSISQDGSKITFVSKRDGNVEVYVMNSDGS
ncbi:MAG: TolB family protein, partial [Candidatus Sericytochromatia bacterium]